MFTGQSKDIDIETLLYLDDKTISNICCINKYMKDICNREDFWLRLIKVRFPYLNLDLLFQYRGKRSWSEYYIRDLRFSLNNKSIYELLISSSIKGRLDHVMIAVNRGDNTQNWLNDVLIQASARGHLEVVKYLSKKGANIHAQNHEALAQASYLGHLEVVKYLVEMGADVQAQGNLSVVHASANGHLDVVKYLVEHGADFSVLDYWAVRLAAYEGHSDLVKYFVERGAPNPT
jgi:ankyrin repeat protein